MSTEVTTPQNPVKALFHREEVQNKFKELMGARSSAFLTSVMQIVFSNDLLAKADPMSIYQASVLSATRNLPWNNSLDFAVKYCTLFHLCK